MIDITSIRNRAVDLLAALRVARSYRELVAFQAGIAAVNARRMELVYEAQRIRADNDALRTELSKRSVEVHTLQAEIAPLREAYEQAQAGLSRRQFDEIETKHAVKLRARDEQIAEAAARIALLEQRIGHQRKHIEERSATRTFASLEEMACAIFEAAHAQENPLSTEGQSITSWSMADVDTRAYFLRIADVAIARHPDRSIERRLCVEYLRKFAATWKEEPQTRWHATTALCDAAQDIERWEHLK